MIPIRELLNRIRWDAEFARGEFELGYFDRTEKQIVHVPLRKLSFPSAGPGTFLVIDAAGCVHRVPLHRVREVFKDGQLIWHRPDNA